LVFEQDEPFVPSKGWAEMIRKVYEVVPLICPSCGGKIIVIAFSEDPKIIDKIIKHLKLSFHAEQPPPPKVVLHELLMADEEREEYF
jgi:DNA-directed RNA polymerase subunit RPC12/RpoP